jgi:hypothetical protein
MGTSVGVLPFGNRYSSRLHFGMSKLGKGEEKGMVVSGKKRLIKMKKMTTTTTKHSSSSSHRQLHREESLIAHGENWD